MPPFRVVRPGLIRLVLDVHGLSVSVLKDCYKRKYNGCSVYALYLPSLIELWDLATILHGIILGFQTRSWFYEILIVTNCKSNDYPEYTLYLPSLY